jgi:hypothetical protein
MKLKADHNLITKLLFKSKEPEPKPIEVTTESDEDLAAEPEVAKQASKRYANKFSRSNKSHQGV